MATNASEQLNVLVRLSSDQAAVQKTTSDIRGVKAEAANLGTGFNKLGPLASAGVEVVRGKFSALHEELELLRDQHLEYRAELERVIDTENAAADAATKRSQAQSAPVVPGGARSSTSSGDVNKARREGVGDLSTTFGAFASAVGGNQVAAALGDVTGFLEYLPTIGTSLAALGPAGIAAVAGGVAVVALFGELANVYDRTAEAARTLIATSREYYDIVLTGTSSDLDAAIEAKRQELEISRAYYEELNTVVETGYGQTRRVLGGWTELYLEATNAGGARELREARDEALEQLGREEFLLGRLEAARAAGVTAANDAAEAEERLAAERAENAANELGVTRTYLNAVNEADRQTAEERLATIEQLNADMAVLQHLARVAQTDELRAGVEEEMATLQARIDAYESFNGLIAAGDREAFAARLEAQATALGESVIAEAAFRRDVESMTAEEREIRRAAIEAELESLSALASSSALTAEQFQQVNDDITVLNMQLGVLGATSETTADRVARAAAQQEAYTQLYDNYFDAISKTADAQARAIQAQQLYDQAVAESEKKLKSLLPEYLSNISKLEQDTQKAIADAQAEAAENRVEIEQDLGDELARIKKDFARSERDAVRDRNADAFEQAVEARDDQEEAAQKQAKRQQEDLEKALAKQVKTAREKFDEQTRIQREAFDRQVAQVTEATNREKSTKKAALDQAQVDLQNAKSLERLLQQQYHADEYNIRAQANSALAVQAYNAGQFMVQQFTAGVLAGMGAVAAQGGGTGGGSYYPQYMPTATGAGGRTTYITINAASDQRTIRTTSNAEARRVINEVLED